MYSYYKALNKISFIDIVNFQLIFKNLLSLLHLPFSFSGNCVVLTEVEGNPNGVGGVNLSEVKYFILVFV